MAAVAEAGERHGRKRLTRQLNPVDKPFVCLAARRAADGRRKRHSAIVKEGVGRSRKSDRERAVVDIFVRANVACGTPWARRSGNVLRHGGYGLPRVDGGGTEEKREVVVRGIGENWVPGNVAVAGREEVERRRDEIGLESSRCLHDI